MLKKLKLDEKAFRNIQDAVKKAEAATSGEIEVAVTAESEPYAFWELFSSVLVSSLLVSSLLSFID